MDIRPPDTPVDDPFWAAVRRRHPDVDIVLLPLEPPEPEPGERAEKAELLDDQSVTDQLTAVAEEAGRLWAAVAPLSTETPEARIRYGSGPGVVRAVARVVDHRSDGYAVLVSLRHELGQAGWVLDRPAGGLERLVGARDGATVKASYAEQTGVLLLELSSADLTVGRDRARERVRAGT